MSFGFGFGFPHGGKAGFSPASLFTSGVAGAWYDPSDYSTLFQDSAGTTPVTAVEQPVGLMLDKSQNLVLGSEYITNAADREFTSDTGFWSKEGNATISGGFANINNVSGTAAIYRFNFPNTPGGYVEVSFDLVLSAGAVEVLYGPAISQTFNTSQRVVVRLNRNAVGTFGIRATGGGTALGTIDNISIKPVLGNHASQATAASRPILRARYNQLTYSEQFDNAFWVKSGATVSANATTAPDGTSTADLVTVTAQYGGVTNTYTGLIIGAQYTYSFYAKSNTGTNVLTLRNDTAGTNIGTYTPTSDWVRYSFTFTAVGTSAQLWPLQDRNASGFGSTYIWGADLRTGSSAGTYQRIAAATDYATAGFLPYLDFVTDDSFATNSIDFTTTDKMSVVAGVTKNSDAAAGTVVEQNAVVGTSSFLLRAPGGASADYAYYSGGSISFGGSAISPATFAAPITNVITGQSDIANDVCKLRVNATQVASVTTDQGTGGYSNLPIYIGRRQSTAVPLVGRIYQLIVCGKTLSASELSATETYVATKTGVTL